jgi:hypothetical protein
VAGAIDVSAYSPLHKQRHAHSNHIIRSSYAETNGYDQNASSFSLLLTLLDAQLIGTSNRFELSPFSERLWRVVRAAAMEQTPIDILKDLASFQHIERERGVKKLASLTTSGAALTLHRRGGMSA